MHCSGRVARFEIEQSIPWSKKIVTKAEKALLTRVINADCSDISIF